MRTALTVLLIIGCLLVTGCPPPQSEPVGLPSRPDYTRPLPRGRMALRRISDLSQLPDFSRARGDTDGLRAAIAGSLSYMAKPSSQKHYPYGAITHAQVVASLEAFDALLEAELTGEQLNAALRQKFDVYTSIGWNGRGGVLFTGYYTPIFEASLTPTDRFRYPLYRPPVSLVKGPEGEILGLRLPTAVMIPVPERQYIESSGFLDGRELVWLTDPFEAYIAHVQGSAQLRLPSGKVITVGYVGSNGRTYVSVSEALVADGHIDADQVSLQTLINFFRTHPGLVDSYVRQNPRFVFFSPSSGPPRGSLNVPVTPMRTLATDKEVYPRASLVFFQAELPRQLTNRIVALPYEGFALDQDTGGAIRAPGRCDIYMGIGDQAGQLAGRTSTVGRLYYLFLKPETMTQEQTTPSVE